MQNKKGSRPGAGQGGRPRSHQLARGPVVFELLRDGRVCVVAPVRGEFRDLRGFLAAMHAEGGAGWTSR